MAEILGSNSNPDGGIVFAYHYMILSGMGLLSLTQTILPFQSKKNQTIQNQIMHFPDYISMIRKSLKLLRS